MRSYTNKSTEPRWNDVIDFDNLELEPHLQTLIISLHFEGATKIHTLGQTTLNLGVVRRSGRSNQGSLPLNGPNGLPVGVVFLKWKVEEMVPGMASMLDYPVGTVVKTKKLGPMEAIWGRDYGPNLGPLSPFGQFKDGRAGLIGKESIGELALGSRTKKIRSRGMGMPRSVRASMRGSMGPLGVGGAGGGSMGLSGGLFGRGRAGSVPRLVKSEIQNLSGLGPIKMGGGISGAYPNFYTTGKSGFPQFPLDRSGSVDAY